MGEPAAPTRPGFEARVIARAWADEDFRARLKDDPRAAIAEETGITMPASLTVEVLEETAEKAYLVIPATRAVLSEEELAAASGGQGPDIDVHLTHITSSHLS